MGQQRTVKKGPKDSGEPGKSQFLNPSAGDRATRRVDPDRGQTDGADARQSAHVVHRPEAREPGGPEPPGGLPGEAQGDPLPAHHAETRAFPHRLERLVVQLDQSGQNLYHGPTVTSM